MMQPFTALLLALALFSSTSASPIADVAVVKQVAGDLGPVVILPSWINPVTGTIWQIGSRQNVQWNSDNVLPEIQADHNASLLLGYVGADNIVYVDSGKFHLARAHALLLGVICYSVLKSYLRRESPCD